jgi:hypothetical protein
MRRRPLFGLVTYFKVVVASFTRYAYFASLVEHSMLKLLHLFRQAFMSGGSLAVSADCHPVFSGPPEASVGAIRMPPRGAARRLHHIGLEHACYFFGY